MILGVADNQVSVLVAQVGGIDDLDRRADGRLGVGVVDERGDDLVDRDRARRA